jgi:hypothetical protein
LYSHKVGHRSAGAGETALDVFKINLIRSILEKEREKLLFESSVVRTSGGYFFHSLPEI